jgi:hypothetical protein
MAELLTMRKLCVVLKHREITYGLGNVWRIRATTHIKRAASFRPFGLVAEAVVTQLPK